MSFSHASVVETRQLSSRLRRLVLRVDDPDALGVKPAGDSAVGVYFAPHDHPTAKVATTPCAIATVRWSRSTSCGTPAAPAPAGRPAPPRETAWCSTTRGRGTGPLPTRGGSCSSATCPASGRSAHHRGTAATAHGDPDRRGRRRRRPRLPPRRDSVTVVPRIGTGNGSRQAHRPTPCATTRCRQRAATAGSPGRRPNPAPSANTSGPRAGHTDRYDITGYWRADSEAWDARFAAAGTPHGRLRRALACRQATTGVRGVRRGLSGSAWSWPPRPRAALGRSRPPARAFKLLGIPVEIPTTRESPRHSGSADELPSSRLRLSNVAVRSGEIVASIEASRAAAVAHPVGAAHYS